MTTQAKQIENLKAIQTEELNNNFLNGDLYNTCEDMIYKINTNGSLIDVEVEIGETYGAKTMKQIKNAK